MLFIVFYLKKKVDLFYKKKNQNNILLYFSSWKYFYIFVEVTIIIKLLKLVKIKMQLVKFYGCTIIKFQRENHY